MIPLTTQPVCCMPSASRDGNAAPTEISFQSAGPTSIKGMIRLEGGTFLMGTDRADLAWSGDGEMPPREAIVAPFSIAECATTNEEFEEFVNATNYTTEAEKFGWSYVFHREVTVKAKRAQAGVAAGTEWWVGIEGACWKRPQGPGSSIRKIADHPVVHISWNDAVAFCQRVGKRLPTEAEWEFAARGGLEQKIYPWGDELTPGSKHMCNIWQGKFPTFNSGADGYTGTAPVKSFAPNNFGLYNCAGNVWEWCSDWFSPFTRNSSQGESKIIKGGSYLCHASYCNRYRVAARTANTPDSSSSHAGFRCAMNV